MATITATECTAHVFLARRPETAGRAREWARIAVTQWGIDGSSADDVELIVSELVTNAVVHASGPIRADLRIGAGNLRIEVHDGGPAPVRTAHLDSGVHGRGWVITEALAATSGMDTAPGHTVAWAELNTAPDQ
jgi:anti-sigma regulatory factor (Ser/Thr protein kinase)